MPPYGRGNSPPPEIRPITDDRIPSPAGPSYPHQHYQHHPNPSAPGGIAAGAPPPTAALAAAEAAARERDDRPANGFKRMLEGEEDYKAMHKKPANGENRSRLEDHHHHRASPPDRIPSPRDGHSRGSSEVRREDVRRTNENYHPSEAAHHPPLLPSMHQAQDHLPSSIDAPRDDRREAYEAAARKMEVDEDYDEEGEDEKRIGGSGGRSTPQRGMMNGPTKIEAQS